MNTLFMLGGLNMLISVALGAFGAHALKKRLSPEMLKVYHTGVEYQIAHALGLILIGVVSNLPSVNGSLIITAGWLIVAGIVLFSGSLYALSLSGIKKLGAITPIGGLAFLAGWLVFMIAVLGN
ncbi:DUF423 domain-containing protein [Paenibacillus sp. LMG 31456]|uniref:DUF423 domain-containing protein n=1 Tax=Paenibacillus foliorum TaxID=2654974 RepID=A0A972GYQ9_9BACL|nr:DUF423 domain-containing protein [Paenibacillus foliorum]NOU96257.1 DUF423 domain-containing protein [Paenibacillus foliorum]